MNYVIGIDQNGGNIRAGVYGTDGSDLGGYTAEAAVVADSDGRDAFAPLAWKTACFEAIRGAVQQSGVAGSDVLAICCCGHNSETILLGEDKAPLCNCPSGRGRRYPQESAQLAAIPALWELSGNPLLHENTAERLLWYKNHEPELLARCRHILAVKDWLNFCLTGTLSTDVATASFAQLFDVKQRCWSTELMALLGLDAAILPPALECQDLIGTLTDEAAQACGLPTSVAVVAGVTNKASVELASLSVEDGDCAITVGMAGNIMAHSVAYPLDERKRTQAICSAVRGEYFAMCDTNTCAASLAWFGRSFVPGFQMPRGKGGAPFAPVEALAEQSAPGANGVLFLPYLKGEKTPVWDERAKGVFFGLTEKTTPADMARAVMEGATYSIMSCMDDLKELGLGQGTRHYRMMGSAPLWLQTIADMTEQEAKTLTGPNGPMFGAAVVAACGAGVYPDARAAAKAMVREGESYLPGVTPYERYQEQYAVYGRLYGAFKYAAEG